MKGTKYLSELVDLSLLKKNKLNMIQAPTGSGKTVFAIEHIPSLTVNAYRTVVFLIDTINGKEQLLRNPKAASDTYEWAREIDESGHWFSDDNRVVIMTYAKFGVLSQKYTDFHANFDYIICDELHSLINFQHYSLKPNIHSIALMMLKSAVRNNRTTVIALSATPKKLQEEFGSFYYEIPINHDDLIQYEVEEIIPYSNIDFILSTIDLSDIGVCYTARINKMREIEMQAKKLGFQPVSIWSIRNAENPMTEEQLTVRSSILQTYQIPKEYNLLIINASSETSIKIKSKVDYVIVNNSDEETQIQVRGRVNSDLKKLYIPSSQTDQIVIPNNYLGVRLFRDQKNALCDWLNLQNNYGRMRRWPTIKNRLIEQGYSIEEGRQNNLRYSIITLSDE